MKAIQQKSYGSARTLSLVDLPRPEPRPNEVLVRVVASDLHRGDWRLRTGDFPGVTFVPGRLAMGLTGPRKQTPGTSFAGRVVAVGSDVTRYAVGDDVFGSSMHGAHAELMVVAEDGPMATMPANVDYEEAAALPYGAGTAVTFLSHLAGVQKGDRVCIVGATGGVGRIAVQYARHLGAHVTAVASAPNHALARRLGADHVVDYRSEDFREAGAPYDVILDTIGASSFGECGGALAPGGRYLSLIITVRLLLSMLVTSFGRGRKALTGVAAGGAEGMSQVRDLVEAGAFRGVVDRVFPFERIHEAHAYLDSRAAHGSVVVRIAEPSALAPVLDIAA